MPGVISSLFLMIVGAVARYAYSDSVFTWDSHSLQIDTIGLILILAGLVGLIISVAYGFLRPKEVEEVPVVEEPVKVVRKRSIPKKKV